MNKNLLKNIHFLPENADLAKIMQFEDKPFFFKKFKREASKHS